MKAAWYEKNGTAADVLIVGTMPDPSPGEGEVRVRVHASGVNPSDVKSRAGRPLGGPRVIPHSDGAGVIDQVGAGVAQARLGERVWIWNGQWKRPHGTAAEFIVLPQEQAVPLPDETSFAEGACLGVPALTALRALLVDGPIAGKSVLVAGGAGSVGAYAIQFARLLGAANVITTVSSAAKQELTLGLGAHHAVNYRSEDVIERVKELTGGHGAARIVEVDAAANVALVPEIIAQDGLYVIYGSGKDEIPFGFAPMIIAGVGVRFFIVYAMSPIARAETVAALDSYLRAGLVRHHLAQFFALDDVVAAHEAVESGKVIGNVVLKLLD